MMHFKLLLGMCLLHFFLKANSHHLFGAKSDDSDVGHDTSLMDAHQDQLDHSHQHAIKLEKNKAKSLLRRSRNVRGLLEECLEGCRGEEIVEVL